MEMKLSNGEKRQIATVVTIFFAEDGTFTLGANINDEEKVKSLMNAAMVKINAGDTKVTNNGGL